MLAGYSPRRVGTAMQIHTRIVRPTYALFRTIIVRRRICPRVFLALETTPFAFSPLGRARKSLRLKGFPIVEGLGKVCGAAIEATESLKRDKRCFSTGYSRGRATVPCGILSRTLANGEPATVHRSIVPIPPAASRRHSRLVEARNSVHSREFASESGHSVDQRDFLRFLAATSRVSPGSPSFFSRLLPYGATFRHEGRGRQDFIQRNPDTPAEIQRDTPFPTLPILT